MLGRETGLQDFFIKTQWQEVGRSTRASNYQRTPCSEEKEKLSLSGQFGES